MVNEFALFDDSFLDNIEESKNQFLKIRKQTLLLILIKLKIRIRK